jgi:hypothetical protein
MGKEKYIRFVVNDVDPESSVNAGVFQPAYRLIKSGSLLDHEVKEIQAITSWFEVHLTVPKRFSASSSKGYYRRPRKAISWFKASADEHVRKIRELVNILKRHGVVVHTIITDRPGYIVHEDEYQITAEPFAETLGN